MESLTALPTLARIAAADAAGWSLCEALQDAAARTARWDPAQRHQIWYGLTDGAVLVLRNQTDRLGRERYGLYEVEYRDAAGRVLACEKIAPGPRARGHACGRCGYIHGTDAAAQRCARREMR